MHNGCFQAWDKKEQLTLSDRVRHFYRWSLRLSPMCSPHHRQLAAPRGAASQSCLPGSYPPRPSPAVGPRMSSIVDLIPPYPPRLGLRTALDSDSFWEAPDQPKHSVIHEGQFGVWQEKLA